MSELVANCPRCGSQKITFDVLHQNHFNIQSGWQYWFEVFCVCRHCRRATVFIVSQALAFDNIEYLHKISLSQVPGSLNRYVNVEGFISLKDIATSMPPEYLPEKITSAFKEGAVCMATNCYNAAATMFRLCIDLATRELLPAEGNDGLTPAIRHNLGQRLPWLFNHQKLPSGLKELSICIKEDGNDGAHAGTLKKEDAQDIEDFRFSPLLCG